MLTETEHKKRRSGLVAKLERAKEEYGASAMAESDDEESPTLQKKRDAFETAQQNLARIDAAWEAGAKTRHIAAEEDAERQKQE